MSIVFLSMVALLLSMNCSKVAHGNNGSSVVGLEHDEYFSKVRIKYRLLVVVGNVRQSSTKAMATVIIR